MVVRGPRDACDETSLAKLSERFMRAGKAVTVVFGLAVIVIGALFVIRGFGIYLW